MSFRNVIICAVLGLSGSFTAHAASVADLVENPSWDLSEQLAEEGNVHTAELMTAFQTSTDDYVRGFLLQTLIMIAEPSSERTAFLQTGATDPSLTSDFRLWMKVGLACDAPNDETVIAQLLADETITDYDSWSLINIRSLQSRSPALHATIVNIVIDHIIALIKTDSPLITRHSLSLVVDFIAGLRDQAGPDSLLQERIEALAGDDTLPTIDYDLGRPSVASILSALAGAHVSALPTRTSELLLNYFLNANILQGDADESDERWMSRRYRLLEFTSGILGGLKYHARPSYESMVEASVAALLSSDIPEAQVGGANHVKFVTDPLKTLETLLLNGNGRNESVALSVLRDMDLMPTDTDRDEFKNIMALSKRMAFDATLPLDARFSPALTLIHFEQESSESARATIREGLWSDDQKIYRDAVWYMAQFPTYNTDDAKSVATALNRMDDEDFIVDLLDLIRNALEHPAKRTVWLEEQTISSMLLIHVRAHGRMGDAAAETLNIYIDLLRTL